MSTHYPSNRSPLQPGAFTPLPLGAVRPRGWLLDQCRLQASGLTGHIEECWADLGADNMWLGGQREGWERAPYYLDGLIPLAWLLDSDELRGKAQRWIEAILSQQTEDGWIGPVQAPGYKPYDPWPIAIVLKGLTQYHEATGDERVPLLMARFFQYLLRTLHERPLFEWGKYRWADLVLSIHWLYNRTGEMWLLDVAAEVARQGYDWRSHFSAFPYREKTPREKATLSTHVVNNAMGIKTGGVWWAQSGDEADRRSVYRALEVLDAFHGQATGVFTGDEHLAGRDPSQGTELCAVVEYMFTLEQLIAIMGDPALSDRLERIAYNALPATCTPDMWAHQYDQQANQVLCSIAPRQWTTNGDDSNIYGLEPHYGCCTSNMHQGWPKLAKSVWMAAPDGGLAAVIYAPSSVTARVGSGAEVTLAMETDYPFKGSVRIAYHGARPAQFPVHLRIPSWARHATVQVMTQQPLPVAPGSYFRLERMWRPTEYVTLELPMEVRVERRYHNSAAIHRGPLVYALHVGDEFRPIKGSPPCADYEVRPTTFWDFGLSLGKSGAEQAFEVQETPLRPVPFERNYAPVTLVGNGRRLPEWTMEENSAGPLPESPVTSEEPVERVELIPYGCTNLRITEFPVLEE